MAEPKTLEEALEVVVQKRLTKLTEKQKRYGPDNILKGGVLGVLMRKRDKLERAWTLTGLSQLCQCKDAWEFARKVAAGEIVPPPDDYGESLMDTIQDDGNYADIILLLMEGWWGLPLEDAGHAASSSSPCCSQGTAPSPADPRP